MELVTMHSTLMSGAVLVAAMIAVCAYASDDVREIHNPLGFATSMTNANNGDQVALVLDNWTHQPWHYTGTANGFATGTIKQSVAAGATVAVPLSCDWSLPRVAHPGRRVFHIETTTPSDFPEIRLVQDPDIEIFECFVDDGIQVGFVPRRDLKVEQTTEIVVAITNFTETKQSLSPQYLMEGAAIDASTSVVLEPGDKALVRARVTPSRAGQPSLTVRAGSGQCTRTMVVARSAISDVDLGRIKSAWLQFDSFAQDMAGAKPWQVRINGSAATQMPPDSGSWHGGWRSEIRQPGRFPLEAKTVQAIARSNEGVLSNPNRNAMPYNTAYGFKVRNVLLGLRFEDDSEMVCPANDQDIVTCSDQWLHAEGRQVPLGQDLAWTIRIPGGAD